MARSLWWAEPLGEEREVKEWRRCGDRRQTGVEAWASHFGLHGGIFLGSPTQTDEITMHGVGPSQDKFQCFFKAP